MMTKEASETLTRLLAEGVSRYHAEYADELSSHLPMALVALERLGADGNALERFAKFYSRRLLPRRPLPAGASPLTPETWRHALGRHEHHEELAAFFTRERERLGLDALLRTYLPALLPGVGGAAFHGLIRLAYAVEVDHAGEVAEGLAHWADAYLPLGSRPRPDPGADPVELLGALSADADVLALRFEGPNIFSRMAGAAVEPVVRRHLAVAPAGATALRQLAGAALRIYLATKNFTALHLVTSAHALRILAPYATAGDGGLDAALASYWQAFITAFVTIGCPPLGPEPAPRGDLPPWGAVLAAAAASRDDHTIKLAYTCREEETAYGSPLYRQAAALRAKVDSSPLS